MSRSQQCWVKIFWNSQMGRGWLLPSGSLPVSLMLPLLSVGFLRACLSGSSLDQPKRLVFRLIQAKKHRLNTVLQKVTSSVSSSFQGCEVKFVAHFDKDRLMSGSLHYRLLVYKQGLNEWCLQHAYARFRNSRFTFPLRQITTEGN